MTWYQLYDVLQSQAYEAAQPGTGREPPPIACPKCGEPLLPGNAWDNTVQLYCPFDFWKYPRDWVRPAGP